MQYKVLPGREWFSLKQVYRAGDIVELPEVEGNPFVGKILEVVEQPATVAPEPAKAKPNKAAKGNP